MSASAARAAPTILAESFDPFRDHISLMHGWVPVTVQAVAAVTAIAAVGWRTRRWRLAALPVAALAGLLLAGAVYWSIASNGLAGEPAPAQMWVWIALTGFAAVVALLGWRSARWWRRITAVAAVPLCALSAGLMLNYWVGYFPTVQTAWGQLTGGPLPGQTDPYTVSRMLAEQDVPATGKVVPVNIPATVSKFKHRGELVYLPPVYFSSNPPPALPVVMMIGGQFNTPADWIRAGTAVDTIDDFAARHGGNAPLFVFADSGGAFNNDTGCVNGPRGNAGDYLTKDVVPYMISTFGVSDDPANWGVLGWSSGGTCALNLTVKYPELFNAFVNIDGDFAPNAGDRQQTIDRLFSGDAGAYAQWDPATVIAENGPFEDLAGWFAVSTPPGTKTHPVAGPALPEQQADATPDTPVAAARALCRLGSEYGIDCAVVPETGKHDWPFAGRVLRSALPWLAGRIGTPDVPEIPLPGTSGTNGVSVTADGGPQTGPASRASGVR